MTNKRIHVSAIVLLIAAIIIDMHNNGLCPLAAPVPVRATKITGSFMVRGSVATGSGYRVPYTGHCARGRSRPKNNPKAIISSARPARKVCYEEQESVQLCTAVYGCVCVPLCLFHCLCLQMLIDYTVRDEIITSN